MVKSKKSEFRKMVLLPYDDIQKAVAKPDHEFDFSTHTDTPYMKHIKLQMNKILSSTRLSPREKHLIYNQLQRKYYVTKANLMNATTPKTSELFVPSQVPEPDDNSPAPPPSHPNEDLLWFNDEEMPIASSTVEANSSFFNRPRNLEMYRDHHPELTDDDSTDYEDMSASEAQPYTQMRPVHENIRPRNLKRSLEADYVDDEEEKARSSKRKSTLDEIQEHIRRRNSKRYPEDRAEGAEEDLRLRNSKRYLKDQSEGAEEPRLGANSSVKLQAIRRRDRRNAIDSPPREAHAARLRRHIARPEPARKNIVPSDDELYSRASVIDRRFMKNPRKREASKLFAGKRSWLGRLRRHDIPPNRKQPKFVATDASDDDDDEEGAVGGVKWSQLRK